MVVEVGHAAEPPAQILGYTIRSRTRIYVSYVLPACLAQLVYLLQMSSDIALSYQHFRQQEPGYGAGTLVLVLIPPLLTFVLVLTSREQRNEATQQRGTLASCGWALLQLLLFPLVVMHR